ncbi:MAG: aldolase/citrate lyase family protein [Thermoplasmata archaeon]
MPAAEPLRARLLAGRTVHWGSWISLCSLPVVDALRDLPFDWLVIDTEHSPVDPERVAAMVALLRAAGPSPLVRVGGLDPHAIKRALDAGAEGIVVPLVDRPEEAGQAVAFAKYPPQGIRGAAATAASRYGRDLPRSLRHANDETLVAVQIETAGGLAHADEIAAVPGVDVLFVGPQDLAMGLGEVDRRSGPVVREAMARVVRACEAHGKVPGTMAIDRAERDAAVALGFRFVSLASDLRFLLDGARALLPGAPRRDAADQEPSQEAREESRPSAAPQHRASAARAERSASEGP